jgi:hypothetical protein
VSFDFDGFHGIFANSTIRIYIHSFRLS